MESTKAFNEQITVAKILWGALTFSNLVIAGIVTFDLVKVGQYPMDKISIFSFAAALVLAIGNAVVFTKTTSILAIRDIFSKQTTDINFNQQVPQATRDAIESLSDQEKKLYNTIGVINSKLILHWALCEAISIIGMVAIILGLPKEQFYAFTVVALALMAYMFPKHNQYLKQI